MRGAGRSGFLPIVLGALLFPSCSRPIYVADSGNHRIVRVNNMTGAGWTTFGSQGNGISQFDHPRSLFVESNGTVYITDWNNHRIVRINDMTGAGWISFGSRGRGVNQFEYPTDLHLDSQGRIYVLDAGNQRLVRIDDMTGAGWQTFSGDGNAPVYVTGGIANPFSGAVHANVSDGQGSILVMDPWQRRFVMVNASMTGFGQIPSFKLTGHDVFADNIFGYADLFVDEDGGIYISADCRVVRIKIDITTQFASWGSCGDGFQEFQAMGLFVRQELDGGSIKRAIYLTDRNHGRIARLTRGPGELFDRTFLGSVGSGINQFNTPTGIFVQP
jgi:hypothetical protein